MKQTFAATAPDGIIFKRTSETHSYSHAVIAKFRAGWKAVHWCGSRDLARKAVAASMWKTIWSDVVTVRVTPV